MKTEPKGAADGILAVQAYFLSGDPEHLKHLPELTAASSLSEPLCPVQCTIFVLFFNMLK